MKDFHHESTAHRSNEIVATKEFSLSVQVNQKLRKNDKRAWFPNRFEFVREKLFAILLCEIRCGPFSVWVRCALSLFDNKINGGSNRPDYKWKTFYILFSNNILSHFRFLSCAPTVYTVHVHTHTYIERSRIGHGMIARFVLTCASMALPPNHNQQKCR